MPVDHVRDGAIDVLLRVFEKGMHLNVALDRTLRRKNITGRGRRFLTQITYGTVRHRALTDYILGGLVEKSLDTLPAPILAVLRMGVYQALFCNQVTFPAMVHTSVELAKKRGHRGTTGLVNAVLKKAPQSLQDIDFPDQKKNFARYLSIRYSFPKWITRSWIEELGEKDAERLCEASNEQAPTALRINALATSHEKVKHRMGKSGFLLEKRTTIPEELTVIEGNPPARTKFFQEGLFILQDPASMIAAHLLDAQENETILDLCAAPGGKATHLAELTKDKAHIVAMDKSPRRLVLVQENIQRLNLSSVLAVAADGLSPPFKGPFDRVLVDAPCTGLGTIRRNPDLKWRVQADAPQRLSVIQRELLRSAVGLCKNGGVIVYAVCTMTLDETQGVVQDILNDGGLTLEDGPEYLAKWKTNKGTYRTLPNDDLLDGFYLTRLRKA